MNTLKIEMNLLFTSFKASLFKLIAIVIAFLMPVQPLLIIVGMALFADTICGIWKASKAKEKITSRKMSNLITKMVLYQSAVILFFVLEKFMLGDFITYFVAIPLFLTKIVATTLVFIELTSINENMKSILGYSFWQKFKELISRAKEVKSEISSLTDNKEENEAK